jgi:hypothetical protein
MARTRIQVVEERFEVLKALSEANKSEDVVKLRMKLNDLDAELAEFPQERPRYLDGDPDWWPLVTGE